MTILSESLAYRIGKAAIPADNIDQTGAAPREGHSYVVGDKSVDLRHITIPQLLAETVARHGPRDAVVLAKEGRTLSYYDLDREVDALHLVCWPWGWEKGTGWASGSPIGLSGF
jgi:fatty-acyl-CoA synthase